MPKHFFFDLDKTLTTSRSPMAAEHRTIFEHLCRERDVIVVSGGNSAQIRQQVTPQFDGKYYIMGQSGNEAIGKDGAVFWNDVLTGEQQAAIEAFVEHLKKHFAIEVRDPDDLLDHRGAQTSYSVIGFHEDVDKKYAFDPDDSRRQAALKALETEKKALTAAGVEVVPAGTTTYNFVALGKHKGNNVARFVELMGWNKDECIYLGDALFPGGNDETVIGVIPTHPVKDPDETFAFISAQLA